jgi:hypothetical protein
VTQTAPKPEQPRRRWLRFSLRTLFMLVTVLCCWLAWESHVVRQRKQLLREVRESWAVNITTAADWSQRFPPHATIDPPPVSISPVRVWLGDQAIQEISYYDYSGAPSQEKLQRLAQTFPEAKLRREDPPLEPCHPGCFPYGTLVQTPGGLCPIEEIQAGDPIFSPGPAGVLRTINVQSVFVTDNRLWHLRTDQGDLITTETQPLCQALDQFVPAGKLQPGDTILCLRDGETLAATVLGVESTGRIERVVNLILGDREVFIAGGFLARSKPPAQPLVTTLQRDDL